MDLDLNYPALSRLANDNGLSLSAIAATARDHDGYITLADCCQLASRNAPDCYHYLATLDRFSELLKNDAQSRKTVWKKIYRQKESSFLDAIAEAAWVIYFDSIGAKYEVEVPFSNDPNSKNADIKLGNIWLDVVNIKLRPLSKTRESGLVFPNSEVAQKNLLLELRKRAIKKYNEKFKGVIELGLLSNPSVGILICIIKSEKAVIFPFMHEIMEGIPIQIPPDLFSKSPRGLNVVQVFRLAPKDQHGYLEPKVIFNWQNEI